MNKCVIDIAPNGETQLRFVLNAGILNTPLAGIPFSRSRITPLADDALRRLRFGDAPDDLVKEVTTKLSEWFLGSDLNQQLVTALNLSAGREPIRLIFSINDESLRDLLADVPFELIMLSGSPDPLVLNPHVASIVHLLNKVGTPSTKSSNWPLKILIVRSNPKDLGGAIPPAEPIRQSIVKIMAEDPALKPDLVRVDILSSEDAPQLAGRPTKEGLEIQLPKVPYDILVYLGHGDISSEVSPGKKVVGGVLQLEDETGDHHRMLDARKLAKLLRDPNPVNVVLLLGCLTAAENIPEDMRDGVRKLIPQWLQGSQGVAQVLINSESGVQFVVGMRYKIDTQDALDFLDFFFRNLLKLKPGNVEAAVRSARNKLADKSYMWSAPVVFSTLSEEPLFPFIEDTPECPSFEASERLRTSLWKSLSKLNWNLREQPPMKELVSEWLASLSECELEIVDGMKAHSATLIAPGFGEFKAGEEIRLPVRLFGTLKDVEEIEGKISIAAGLPQIAKLEASKHLSDSNYELNSLDNNSGFLIRRSVSGGGPLNGGDLFDIVMTVPSETQGVLPVSVNKIRTKPMMRVCPGNNAFVLPLP